MDRREQLRGYIRSVFDRGSLVGPDGNDRPITPVGLAEAHGEALRDLAVQAGARRTIETGLGPGISTLFLCEALLAAGTAEVGHVAVDPLQEMLFGNIGLHSLETAGVRDLVEFVPDPADVALPLLLRDRRGTFDLGFVDGDHHFDNAFVDCFYLYQLLKPGGLLIVDDAWMPAVGLVVRYMMTNLECEPVASPFGDDAGTPKIAVLRTPRSPAMRPWDSFVPFVPESRRRIRLPERANQVVRRLRERAAGARV